MIRHDNPAALAEPPPAFERELHDGDVVVGRTTASTIAFIGFGDEVEASHAAWAAHRTLSWRLAARSDRRPVPVDLEPLTLSWEADERYVNASRRRIARLIQPGESGMGWGFELPLPEPLSEVFVTAKANTIYRMLRRSGMRWRLWRREVTA